MYNKIKDSSIKILGLIILLFLIIYSGLKFLPYPALTDFLNQTYSFTFYDSDEKLVQVTSLKDGLKKEYTPLEQIPFQVQTIFINAEDNRFYRHGAVDFLSIGGAVIQNLTAKKTVRGASTLSMQLAKIISQENDESSRNLSPIVKKLSDCINAARIEAKLSKKQILQLYLNNIPFGMNVSGITSASRTFFGKELRDLSPYELCVLAVIPRSPTLNNPVKNPENAVKKSLALYIKINNLKNKEDLLSAQQKITEAVNSAIQFKYPFEMPHYVNYQKSILEPSLDKNKIYKKFDSDFYKIHLSANLELYSYAEKLLQQSQTQAEKSRINNSSLVIIDNKNGSVLCWIGNNDFFDSNSNGQVDGVLAKNQMGSSMKPFLYALALEQKNKNNLSTYYPSKILSDIPKSFGNEKLYIPSNFNNQFNGPVRFRVALASSLNVTAVSLLDEIGTEKYLETLYKLGFESLKYKDNGTNADLGLALGAGEVTLLELTKAFSVFPNDGILKNNDLKGNLIENRIYSSDTSRLICSILSDKASRALGFGYNQTFQTDYPSIFKTGTSNQFQNIVALGASKNYTIGVWMGNFNGETVVGKTGSSLPAFVAKNLLDYLEEGKNNSELQFMEPENWKKEKICSLSGMKATKNCQATIEDYIEKGFENPDCNYHKLIDGKICTVYPEEYEKWLTMTDFTETHSQENTIPLTVITPKDKSIFYFSNQNQKNQALPVEIIGGTDSQIEVYYDNNYFATFTKPYNFTLPVEKGNHTCTVINSAETISFSYKIN